MTKSAEDAWHNIFRNEHAGSVVAKTHTSHVVAEEDQAAALEAGEEPPECPLCLSTVLPGETIRTLPCSQYAAPGTNGLPLHAHHPRSTLTLHSRVFAQLAAPSTKRASIGG